MMKTKTNFLKRGALALLTLLFGLCLALGLYYTVPKVSHAAEEPATAFTLNGSDNETEWNKAIAASKAGKSVTVTLSADWTATEGGFGSGEGFEGGAILVTGNVTLALGNYKIDRGLDQEATPADNGQVIRVAAGSTLTVNGGTLKGGNGGQGGAIYASANSLTNRISIALNGVTISGNHAATGAGIYLGEFASLKANGLTVEDNTATTNGAGIYLAGTGSNSRAEATLSGKVIVQNNFLPQTKAIVNVAGETPSTKEIDVKQQSNICFGSSYVLSIGELDAQSKIGISPNSSQTVLASDYKEHNKEGKWIAINPDKYFFIDYDLPVEEEDVTAYKAQLEHKNGYVALDGNGNVARSTASMAMAFEVYFEQATTETPNPEHETVENYGVEIDYGEKVCRVVWDSNDFKLPGSRIITEVNRNDNGEVVPYTLTNIIGGVSIAFDVVVMPTDISGATVTLDKNEFEYTGAAHSPAVTVKLDDTTLVLGTDYEVEYENNTAVGEATVTVTGIGNYVTETPIKVPFTVIPSETQYSAIGWEYSVDGVWTETAPKFTYNGNDQSQGIRAKLAFGDVVEYVYLKDTQEQDGMFLEVTGDTVNAGTFTVTLNHDKGANATFPTENYDYDTTVTIDPKEVDLALTGNELNLWRVGYNGLYSALIDGTGNQYMNGNTPTNCPVKEAVYADYREGTLTLTLNPEYSLDGVLLDAYLKSAQGEIAYTNNSGSSTSNAAPKQIETSVTFTLNNNFKAPNENKVTLTKTWYIVTLANNFTTIAGEDVPAPFDWTYGSKIGVTLLRPRNGNEVVYTFTSGEEQIGKFATVVEGMDVKYYRVNTSGGALTSSPINVENYFEDFVSNLGAGDYKMTATATGTGVVPATRTFAFTVFPFHIAKDGELNEGLELKFASTVVVYNGQTNNVPELTLTFNGKTLQEGVDYELSSKDKDVKPNGGKAELVITGIGGLDGELKLPDAYTITRAQNSWIRVPSIMRWTYKNYDKNVNLITAEPALLDNTRNLWFKISTDAAGLNLVDGLENFTLQNGLVSDLVAEKLADLPVGDYYLFAKVDGNSNYMELAPEGILFHVFTAVNYWEKAPSITAWVQGAYDETENRVTAEAHFGTAEIVITDEKGNVVYDPLNEINTLGKAGVGTYVLTATVAGSGNYSGLSFTSTFRVFDKAGLPWWVTLIVVLGVLLIIAIVLLILSKKGILQMLSGKAVVAIRAKASADATIAAVKANKAAEEAKAALALAEARERIEALRLASEEAKSRPAVEQVEDLEERAQDAAKQAARMQKKAARIQKQADMMKAQATVGVEMEGQFPVPVNPESPAETPAPQTETNAVEEDKGE